MKIGFKTVVIIIGVLFILYTLISLLLDIFTGKDFADISTVTICLMGVMLLAISPKLPNN